MGAVRRLGYKRTARSTPHVNLKYIFKDQKGVYS